MSIIDEIRAKVLLDQFEFSQHAVDQSLKRLVSVTEVRDAIISGEVIEDYPADKYGPSCLILGWTQARRAMHVQCSYPSRPLVKIITLYEPDPLTLDQLPGATTMSEYPQETMVDQPVTYTVELDGQIVVVENVPARVCTETGERFFSPRTVERIHQIIRGGGKPARTINPPVYEFAA